ncbi:acyl-CoA thioesterase domain-containing protein [Nocardia caishijiensis]|uniref:Thioesterase superfamily protein n=1 Tax=Nocardia caishijiensis TaxID=184756 RepID=A0ABQ6YM33_9NOCA|nr:acyl-CoA thioesterase domain-containing protein [Nocardia caishijiensis]KAF0846650.1 thioesterase superfamily protein [Nocardia caishijiensis]
MTEAFFRTRNSRHGIELIPQAEAASGWGEEHMRGLAVSSALARAAEQQMRTIRRPDLTPVRWTVDLFRPARLRPCSASATVVREGKRLCLVDAVLEQDGRHVARASALWLAPGQSPPGAAWSGGARPEPPPLDTALIESQHRLYFTEETGWGDAARSTNDARNTIWHEQIPVVEGEPVTSFQLAAGVADVVNVAVNLGSNGLEFINADISLALARLPVGPAVGFATTERIEEAGIAVGTAVAFDRVGVFGTATLCALADAYRAVDVRSFRPIT